MTKKTRARKTKNGWKTFKKYAIPAGAAVATAAAIYAAHAHSEADGHRKYGDNDSYIHRTGHGTKKVTASEAATSHRAHRLRELDEKSDIKKGRGQKRSIHV